MAAYSYTPLPQTGSHIRLATMLPSKDGTELAITLRAVDLNKNPKYTALSYTWGDPDSRGSILVEGKQLGIPANLVQLLQHLQTRLSENKKSYISRLRSRLTDRPESKSRVGIPFVFWADAICICQTDMQEKNIQVPLMKDIFEKSRQTLAWLGQATSEDEAAMGLLKELASNQSLRDVSNWATHPDILSATTWEALDGFCNKPFWRRVWILQEFLLPERLFIACGSTEFEASVLIEAYQTWFYLCYLDPKANQNRLELPGHVTYLSSITNLSGFLDHRMAFREHGPDKHFGLLGFTGRLVATDPRDKIYGILGVTRHEIVPDYTKSTREVYIEYAKERVRLGLGEFILDYAGSGILADGKRSYSLPSWVLDWNTLGTPGVRRTTTTSGGTLLPTASFRVESDSSLLWVKAIRLQRVVKTYTFEKLVWDDLDFWQEWGRAGEAVYPTGLPTLQALFRTLLLNVDEKTMLRLDDSAEVFYSLATGFFVLLRGLSFQDELRSGGWGVDSYKDFERYLEWVRSGFPFGTLDEAEMEWLKGLFLGPSPRTLHDAQGAKLKEQDMDELLKAFATQIHDTAIQRTFLWTDGGYFGIGPRHSRVGDELIAVKDSGVRGLIRKSGGYEEYVGSCFVLGLMGDSVSSMEGHEDLKVEELVVV